MFEPHHWVYYLNMKILTVFDLPWTFLWHEIQGKKISFSLEKVPPFDIVKIYMNNVCVGYIDGCGNIHGLIENSLLEHEVNQLKFDIKNYIQCKLQIKYSESPIT